MIFDFFGSIDHHHADDSLAYDNVDNSHLDNLNLPDNLSAYHFGVPDGNEFDGLIITNGAHQYLQIGDQHFELDSHMDDLGKYVN